MNQRWTADVLVDAVTGTPLGRNGIVMKPRRSAIGMNPATNQPGIGINSMTCDCGTHAEPTPQVQRALSRRRVLAGSAVVGVLPLLPGLGSIASADGVQRDFGFLPPQAKTEEFTRPMMFPVLPDPDLGKASWSDTYMAPRGNGRKHEGQDLMGKKMLKLLACVDGTIIELRHGSSGNSLYLKGDDGWYYCYLHINNDTPGTDDGKNSFEHAYASGLKQGDKVVKGQHIAYLGDSGNAEGSGSHVHFEIRMPNDKWYNASAVNPKYSLDAAEPAVLGGGSSDSNESNGGIELATTGRYVPFAQPADFVRRQAIDFLGVTPTAAWVDDAVERLEAGSITADDFVVSLMNDDSWAGIVNPTVRLYSAYFLRRPDTSGLKYWVGRVRNKVSLDKVSQDFAVSAEFKERYGKLGNAEFIQTVYPNVFARQPDNGGLLYWTQRLDQGKTRGWVMRQMCESAEYVNNTAADIAVIAAYLGLLQKSPATADFTGWSTMTKANSNAVTELVRFIRTGADYRARVASL